MGRGGSFVGWGIVQLSGGDTMVWGWFVKVWSGDSFLLYIMELVQQSSGNGIVWG